MVIVLLQQDSFNFTQPIVADKQAEVSLSKALATPQTMVLVKAGKNITDVSEPATAIMENSLAESAKPENIYLSLINPMPVKVAIAPVLPASSADIISAMTISADESLVVDSGALEHVKASQTPVQITAVQGSTGKRLKVNNNYYADKVGFVIQIAAFRDLKLPKPFLDTLATIEHQAYQGLLNNQPLVVITSTAFAEKSAAKSALSALPKSILARQPWIKPVAVINSEINAFIHSQ